MSSQKTPGRLALMTRRALGSLTFGFSETR